MTEPHAFTAPTHGASWPAWLRRMVREQGPQMFEGRDNNSRRVRLVYSLLADGRYETAYLPEDGGKL